VWARIVALNRAAEAILRASVSSLLRVKNELRLTISGVAIMTDTDNTGESAIAFYGNILLKKRE